MWSMLPQPAPMGSSMGGAPPSRSPGPTGSTAEQWSEIFPAQPDGAAGLKERGWAAHLRSAAWAARDTKSGAAAAGGAVRQLFSYGRRHQRATWAITGMPTSSSHKIVKRPIECCLGACVWCHLHGLSMASLSNPCTLTGGCLSSAPVGKSGSNGESLSQGQDGLEERDLQTVLRKPLLSASLCMTSCPDVQTSGAGPSAQPLHAAPGNCAVAAVPARAGKAPPHQAYPPQGQQCQGFCAVQQASLSVALHIGCTTKAPLSPPVLLMGWQNMQSSVCLTSP